MGTFPDLRSATNYVPLYPDEFQVIPVTQFSATIAVRALTLPIKSSYHLVSSGTLALLILRAWKSEDSIVDSRNTLGKSERTH